MSDLQNYYSNKDNCLQDLAQARKLFGNKNATIKQYEALDHGLGLMFVYCPKHIQHMAIATMEESDIRRLYI